MTHFLEEVDFLKQENEDKIRLEADNILSSYCQIHDVLAESLQNAIDSIDSRYYQEPTVAIVKIMIEFNALERSITITDTGTGMPWEILQNAPSPNITYKKRDASNRIRNKRSRGEKGVGLSFLTFVCNHLKIKTCNGIETIEIVVENAHKWVQGEVSERPKLRPTGSAPLPVSKELGSEKYTRIEMKDVTTSTYCEGDIFDMSLPELEWTLRTKTAVGNTEPVIFNRKPEPQIEVMLNFVDKGGKEESKQIPYCYLSPEEYLSKNSKIMYEDFLKLKDNKKLHKAQGKALIYRNIKETASGRSIGCYAFAMAPRAFETIIKDSELEEGWSPKDWSGIYIATRSMPTGIIVEQPKNTTSGYWRRVLLILQDDDMNFDVGRKTLRGRAKPMMQDVAVEVWNDIIDYLQALTPDASEVITREKQGKLRLLFQQAEQWENLSFEPVQYLKQPQREQMVVALFYELVGAGILKGYRTLRNNTLDQYDAFIYYKINKYEIGRAEANKIKGDFYEDQIIVEFKHKAEDILEDILDNKKNYQDISLLVCWEMNQKKFEAKEIDVDPIPEESTLYFGSTHRLFFPGIYQAGQRLAVIELKSFIERQKLSK